MVHNRIHTLNNPHLLLPKVVHIPGGLQAALQKHKQWEHHYKIYLNQLEEVVQDQ